MFISGTWGVWLKILSIDVEEEKKTEYKEVINYDRKKSES